VSIPHFVGFNVPNLHYIEDDWRFDSRQRFRLPDEFEITNAFETLTRLGSPVTRIYTVSVRKASDTAGTVRHVIGPREYDEQAFLALDRVVAEASRRNIRLIVPFIDNWHWWGGVAELAALRGKRASAFYTDPELMGDYQELVRRIILRKNTLTGRAYRDEPGIWAWETGNELEAPWAWTEQAARFIKSLDSSRPVIDGVFSPSVREEALASADVDIVTSHHYGSLETTLGLVRTNLERAHGRKPYFVGELGFLAPEGVERVVNTVREGGGLGTLLWSLRTHNRDGGFYWHGENENHGACHFPGFDSGARYRERELFDVIRRLAFSTRGEPVPPSTVPLAPTLLPASTPSALTWQGAAGAASYRVERSRSASGPWDPLASGISDARYPYRPLFTDVTAAPRVPYYYRVFAENPAGASLPSAVLGPLVTSHRVLVDEIEDRGLMSRVDGELEFVTQKPSLFKYDFSRVRGPGGLEYRTPGDLLAVRVYVHVREGAGDVVVGGAAGTTDGFSMTAVDHSGGVDQPTDYRPVRIDARPEGRTRAVRLSVPRGAHVGRVELDYE
jgi:hypothetical protein